VWDNRRHGRICASFHREAAPRVGAETIAHDPVAIAAGFGSATAESSTPEML
jgi:hypothetical protein